MSYAQEDEDGEEGYATFNQSAFEKDAMLLLAPAGSSKLEIQAKQGQALVDYTNRVVKGEKAITAAKVKTLYDKYIGNEEPKATTKENRVAWILHRIRMQCS